MSDGWKENPPKENQLCAPLEVCPAMKSKTKRAENKRNRVTRTSVRLRNLKSICDRIKNAVKEIAIHIS